MLMLSIMFNSLKPNSVADGLMSGDSLPEHWRDSGIQYEQV